MVFRMTETPKCSVALRTIEETTTMGFKDQVRNEVEEANTGNNGDNEREELEQIDVDMSNIPFIKFTPTTLVAGTIPKDEGNPIILFKNYNRLNADDFDAFDEEGNDMRYVSTRYLGIVVDNPRVVTSEEDGLEESVFVETGSDDSTAYRAVNYATEGTNEKFGGEGVSINGDTYEVEGTSTEIDGRAILVVDRTAATSVASKLDKNGAVAAGMDESGQVNDGLIEYPNDGDGDEARYARPFVEMREDMLGNEVGFMVTYRSEVDEEWAERLANDDSANDMMWYSVFDMEDETAVEPTTGDPIVGSYLYWNFDASAGRIPDDQYEFVEQYVDEGLPTDEETIRDNVESNADGFDTDPNADRIVELVQAYAN